MAKKVAQQSAIDMNFDTFKQWVKNYGIALKTEKIFNDEISPNGFFAFMKEFKDWLYSSIHDFLTPNKYDIKYENRIRVYCNYIKEKILPICNAKIKYYSSFKSEFSTQYLNNWLDLEDDFYALACYRNLKMTALYLERGKQDKLWAKTIHLFDNFFNYAQQVVFGHKIEVIRASYFPGAGKTYAGNILCAFWFGYDSEMSILRITYSDDLCKLFIQQIANIIDSKEYRKIFPKFNVGDGLGNKELYLSYSVEVGFQFRFSTVKNFFASTRDGQTTGKRAKALIIDDLTKGADEAFDEKLHKRMVNKYDTEWRSRADGSFQPVIAMGTMWSNIDLLNVIYQRALKDSDNNIVDDEKYKYTQVGYNKDTSVNSVFIATPILDYDTDETTCPLRYTTSAMRKLRGNMEESLWNAVYQQRPTPPEEFLFNWGSLQTYNDETYPLEEMKKYTTEVYAFIDPNRKGIDYCAMGIFKRYLKGNEWSKWYLIDCIFQQLPTKQLYTEIALKIKNHNITRIGYENNIDNSFEEVMYYKLKELGYREPFFIEGFFSSNQSKETKIFNAQFGIRGDIIYPSVKMFSLNSEMGKGMQQFTTWSLSQKYGDHDDFPDMLSMFVKYFCEETQQNSMEVLPSSFRL